MLSPRSLRTQTYFRLSLVPPKITSANSSQRLISVTSALVNQSHFTLHIRRGNTQKSCVELSQTRVKKWRRMRSGKCGMFSGLIASISIKRKPCDLFLLIFQLDLESLLGFAHCKMRLTSLHDSYGS